MILPGYEMVQEIYRGTRRQVWRGRRLSDGRSVIIKAAVDEFPRPEQLNNLRREYAILNQLDLPGVARTVELVQWRDRIALVLEDLGDVTLKHRLAQGLISIDQALAMAEELAGILASVHRQGIVHKDVNPGNIMVHPESGGVTLTDFGIATRLSQETARPAAAHALEGTIAYMSPEQTGRMNREVDYRTDFYSLGVTLYEMLTGHLPYESLDPLEVIHGHIARHPKPPRYHRPEIPELLEALVLKLMAKAPEERYQSGRGLAHDLRRMRDGLNNSGTILPFPLAEQDVPERFVVAQRLYGRTQELLELRAAFDRVADGGAELLLIAGYSGVGKTSLIQALYASIPEAHGQLASGKFDQLARDIPYKGIAQAFRTLLTQRLAEPDGAVVERLADTLRNALGNSARVLIDVIPELERLLGPQPAAPPLGAAEAQNRFNRLFQEFVRAFTAPHQPLLVFLDDLQWADAGTLSLLPLLLEQGAIPGLLLIGAYRDNEVSPTDSLRLTLAELSQRGTPIRELALRPLGLEEVRQLIADTMRSTPEEAGPAAALVHRKTEGNPFFVKQLLQSMARDGVIRFSHEDGKWLLDLAAAERLAAADNVLSLMASRLGRLPAAVQRTLQHAACIGNLFDLETLALVSGADEAVVHDQLTGAIQAGLVLPLDRWDGFRFLHDRVQQAAYALIPEDERRQVHLTIGRRLLANLADGKGETLFEVVNHLNYARDLIEDPAERQRLAQLNLDAGRRAKASAAYPSALGYFTAGASLARSCPGDQDDLLFPLLLEMGEAEYLVGRMQEAESTLLGLLERCRTPLERAEVTDLLVIEYETLSRYEDALAIGLRALRQLGIELPEAEGDAESALRQDVAAIREAIGERDIAGLVELPVLEDATLRHALRLLQSCWTPAYISGRSRLGDLLVARLVLLSVRHGNCEASAFGYLHHAITTGSYLGEYERGAALGALALAVNDRFNDLRLRAVVFHRFAALVAPWRHPFAECIRSAREAVRAASESGNLPVAGYAEFQQAWYGMQLAPDLVSFTERHRPTVDLLTRLQIHSYADMQRVMLQWAAALRGETATNVSLNGPDFNEETYRDTVGRGGIFRALYATVRLELLYSMGRLEEADEFARQEAAAVEVFGGSIWPAVFAFRQGLTLAAIIPAQREEARADSQRLLQAIVSRFERWAASAPANFRHMHLLLQAEQARGMDQVGDAIALYESALEATSHETSPRHRALVNECYAGFWLGRRQPRVAQVFLAEARYGYEQWGASAKVRQLDQRHAGLLTPNSAPTPSSVLQTTNTLEGTLDVVGIMKAAQAISREMDIERLLERILTIALEVAGADHGALLLERHHAPQLRVLAGPQGIEFITPDQRGQEQWREVPASVIQLVRRTGEPLVLGNATTDSRIAHDPQVVRARPRSLLCTPILNQGAMIGVLYMENRLTAEAFTSERTRVLQLLSAQAAVALHNAQLYDALRASQLRYSTMADAVPEILFTADDRGMVDYLSRRFTEFTGMSAETGMGDGWSSTVHPDDQAVTASRLQHSIATWEPFEGEYRLRGADGVYRWFRTRAVPVSGPGEELRWFGVASDVDQSKRHEVELREALEEVRRLKDRLQTENIYLQEQIDSEHGFEEIVGRSAVLRRVLGAVEQVAPVDTTVLISGETGTGKELLARAIHRLSPRRDHALVTVNCGAVAPGLVESELFGHEKGAFTGALSRRLGRFEVADGGTLFLDEIGDLPLDLQVKLLRVLQEGEFERVGGGKPIRVNVRVIAATHRDLETLVKDGKFRADLFYRLNVFPIRSPALRERAADIPELVRYFVLKYATKLGKRVDAIPREVLDRLSAYQWPGNIRELANIIERSVILSRGSTLELEDHPGSPSATARPAVSEDDERARITEALEKTGWRVSGPRGAAVLLGLKPTTLEARMKRLGLKRPVAGAMP